MKRISKWLFISIMAVITVSCKTYAPISVKHVSRIEASEPKNGFYYFLPRTAVNIDVTIIKTEELPGPYASYAERFLGIDNAIRVSTATYHISEITISSSAEPDPDELYFVEHNHRTHAHYPITLKLSESGTIISVNDSPSDIVLEQNQLSKFRLGNLEQQSSFSPFIGINVQERVDTIIEKIIVDTVAIERRSLRRSIIQKPSEVRARELADYILKLRSKQFDLISGFAEITYSREALQFMYDKMEQQEVEYVELFSGITNKTKMRFSYRVLPSIETAGQELILFHFSESRGLDSQPFSGSQPVYVAITPLNTLPQLANHQHVVVPEEDQSNGIFYRLPDYGQIAVMRNNNVIVDARLLISQFGLIKSLPPANFRIKFFPDTGALKSVEGI